jgi:hypothetical protein
MSESETPEPSEALATPAAEEPAPPLQADPEIMEIVVRENTRPRRPGDRNVIYRTKDSRDQADLD